MAQAQPGVEGLFAGEGGASGRFACFRRVYTPAHLASHSKQNVRRMTMLVKRGGAEEGDIPTVALHVAFRKAKTVFETAGSCSGGMGRELTCSIDCDGGEIRVRVKDARSLLVTIPDGARVSEVGSNGEGDERKHFGADDILFRLDRTAPSDCVPVATSAADKAALRRAGRR